MADTMALVLFGDVVNSSKNRVQATTWLRDIVARLDEAYGPRKRAPFGFTQGDEVQGLLAQDADPVVAVLSSVLSPGARPIRWVCIRGPVDPGEGPATQRTGQAFLAARDALGQARSLREHLVIRTGDAEADELLAGMAPALVNLLEGLTDRQREVARLAVLEGLLQSEVADRLKVRRATISVLFARAKVHPIERLAGAIGLVYARAVAAGQPVEDRVDGRAP